MAIPPGICLLQHSSGGFQYSASFRYSSLIGHIPDQRAPIVELENMVILPQSHSLSLFCCFSPDLP